MIEVALMIEGQDGLTWARWQRLAQAAEDLGFVGLYRSDHFTNPNLPDKDSLELWTSLTWLASHTRRIEFGPLVSPVSFRHPTMTARMAAAVDDLSGGRLQLGMGAGWQEREHDVFGRDLLEVEPRFRRFQEGLEIVTRLLRSEAPVSYAGHYYRLRDALLLPRPQRPDGPPIVIGGNGHKYTLPLAARYAQEWNGVYLRPEAFAERSARLDELLRQHNRQPGELRRTMMTGAVFGRDQAAFERKLRGRSIDELRARGAMVGTAGAVAEQLDELAKAGVQRVMLQWLDQDDLDGLEALAALVLPQVTS